MPSPFPGMDPYLEDQEWEDFHSRFNVALSEAIAPGVEPRYIVRVERRIYVEHGLDSDDQIRWADVSVLWSGSQSPLADQPTNSAAAVVPVECINSGPQERRETFLVIRELPTLEIVTIIEVLSPTNKRSSSDGRKQYLSKREEILSSQTNLVELDLLRGGKRLPVTGMPNGDYFAFISRGHRRPKTDVYPWTLQRAMPPIPIPLKQDEAETWVDLQAVFTAVFDRARYRLSLNYDAPLRPPLAESEAAWRESLSIPSRGT